MSDVETERDRDNRSHRQRGECVHQMLNEKGGDAVRPGPVGSVEKEADHDVVTFGVHGVNSRFANMMRRSRINASTRTESDTRDDGRVETQLKSLGEQGTYLRNTQECAE